jgi:hypothetical protein
LNERFIAIRLADFRALQEQLLLQLVGVEGLLPFSMPGRYLAGLFGRYLACGSSGNYWFA